MPHLPQDHLRSQQNLGMELLILVVIIKGSNISLNFQIVSSSLENTMETLKLQRGVLMSIDLQVVVEFL